MKKGGSDPFKILLDPDRLKEKSQRIGSDRIQNTAYRLGGVVFKIHVIAVPLLKMITRNCCCCQDLTGVVRVLTPGSESDPPPAPEPRTGPAAPRRRTRPGPASTGRIYGQQFHIKRSLKIITVHRYRSGIWTV